MASRKRLSGCEYKKIREAKQKCIDKQVGSFTKFLLRPTEVQQSNKDQQLNCNIDCLPSTSSSITRNTSPTKEFELVSYSDTDSTDLNKSIDKNVDDDSLERNILENSVDVHDDPSYWPLKLIDSV